MGRTNGIESRDHELGRTSRTDHRIDDPTLDVPRLGHDIRFVFVAVGGGAVRVGREVAQHRLKYVETVAINCDPGVQELEEYDRRVYLGPESGAVGDTGGSPSVGAHIAHAAQPALERLFEGATFVTILGSLGGGSGTGTLPYVIEAAAKTARVLTVFALKPFRCEGERRAVADRALARLHFVESFVEKQEQGAARLQVLDNESLRSKGRTMAFRDVNQHWGRVIAAHIDRAFIAPSEAVIADYHSGLSVLSPVVSLPVDLPASPPALEPVGMPPVLPQASWAGETLPETELTFEVDPPRGPELP